MRILLAAAFLALAAAASAQPPNAPGEDPLPDGPGKDAVVRVCTACHDATQFAFARHTPEAWDSEIVKMQSAGAEMTPEDQAAISAYLARTFPAAPTEAPSSESPIRP